MTILHHIGNAIREWLLAIPLPAVRGLFLGLLALVLLWVWLLPNEETTPPEGARRWDENLKFGATLALLLQIAIYAFF